MAITKNRARSNRACSSHEVARRASASSKPASMEFLISEDNGGDYHWRIIAGNGGTLAESVSFASYDEAEQAARRVRDGGVQPIDFAARRAAAK